MQGTFHHGCCLMSDENAALSRQEDEKLIRAFVAGDASAFDALVMRYKDMVYTMCYYILGDSHEADDQTQETFLKAYRSLHSFRHDAGFSTWLYRITVNTCKNRLSSLSYRIRKRMVSIHEPDELDRGAVQIADESASPNNDLERKERITIVRKALNRLSADHKTVIVLCDIKGLTYDEIAAITGLDLGTVKSRISRARQELRKMLEGYR